MTTADSAAKRCSFAIFDAYLQSVYLLGKSVHSNRSRDVVLVDRFRFLVASISVVVIQCAY